MTIEDFQSSLAGAEPSPSLSDALQALWWDAKGNWDKAHGLAQRHTSDPASDWVHAYLHRKEGDLSNAMYWYRRAGRPGAGEPLAQEWLAIVGALLEGR